jgi:endonuclease/exonuclease/phosphatase family metal-dependent hydrolase
MRVLTWNLFHGRAVPDRAHGLLGAFATTLAAWSWDVALLQEVPPWWPPVLGAVAGASARSALTSRNELLPLRRAVAARRPDVMKSNGGGANAILVRGQAIAEHRRARLRRRPERRVVHAVRLPDGTWVGNLHAQVHDEGGAQADLARAAQALLGWAGDAPAVLGGDTNTRRPVLPGFRLAGGHGVDHVAARGWVAAGPPEVPVRHGLSDHAPVLVDLRKDDGGLGVV